MSRPIQNRSETVSFPPLSEVDEEGLLMLGGQLKPEWLLAAYRRGIFPWPICYDIWDVLAWFSPDPRAIIELDDLYISKRLRRRIRSRCYQVTCDQDFVGVMAGCAGPRDTESGTWITPEMMDAYEQMHRLGHAHSVEVWREGLLVGGLYGLALDGLFAGESMFFRERDASKVALAHLVGHLRIRGYQLLDIQQLTPHTARMGAIEISRNSYLERLDQALQQPVTFGSQLEELEF